MKYILKMNSQSARKFFLKSESYSNIDLPCYFDFKDIISRINKKLVNKDYKTFFKNGDKARNHNDVNYRIYKNKNGLYDWRPLELIHPFLYVALVNIITKDDNWKMIVSRFEEFSKDKKIKCCSIPISSNSKKSDRKETVYNWVNKIEQETIRLSLKFKYMATTDITNCYSSICTHTISWALHNEEYAKKEKNNHSLLGNMIDDVFQEMNYSQTNGIPQGSVISDFVAEMIIGYGDMLLSNRLKLKKIKDYKILRFRDDYRIFTNSKNDLDIILKELSEVLLHLNFRLNDKKTKVTTDIITSSMKEDKYEYIDYKLNSDMHIEKQLLIIKKIGDKYANSSRQKVFLHELYENNIKKLERKQKNYMQLISILVDIAYNNPNNLNICILLINELLYYLSDNKKVEIIKDIKKKFSDIPNTEFLSIWLQRIIISTNKKVNFEELICKKVEDSSICIWNSEWLNFDIKENKIINNKKINNISKKISVEEIDSFNVYKYN